MVCVFISTFFLMSGQQNVTSRKDILKIFLSLTVSLNVQRSRIKASLYIQLYICRHKVVCMANDGDLGLYA